MRTKKQTIGYWLVFGIFVAAIIAFFCSSCKPLPPSRTADGIVYGNDGINTGWYAYCLATGDVIEQEGIRMGFDNQYWTTYSGNDGLGGRKWIHVAEGVQEIKSNGITGPGGQMIVKGNRLDWTAMPGYYLWNHADITNPKGGWFSCSFAYRTNAGDKSQYAVGGGGLGDKLPRYAASKSAMASEAATNPPVSGIFIAKCSIQQNQGNSGSGCLKELSSLITCNITGSENYLRYASPVRFYTVFATSQPEDLTGTVISAIIRSDTCPAGIQVDVTISGSNADKMTHFAQTDWFLPVDSEIQVPATVAVYDRWTPFQDPNIWNPEQNMIEKKDWWLSLVDPNLYKDPNTCPDPNVFFDPHNPAFFTFTSRLDTTAEKFDQILIPSRIVQVQTISLGSVGDNLDINVNWSDPRLIMLIAPNWLTGNKLYDTNNDGIVNYKDICQWK